MCSQEVSTTNTKQSCKISGYDKNTLEKYLDITDIFKLPGPNEIPTIDVAKATLEYFQRWDFRRIEKGKCKNHENKVKREPRNCTPTSFTSLDCERQSQIMKQIIYRHFKEHKKVFSQHGSKTNHVTPVHLWDSVLNSVLDRRETVDITVLDLNKCCLKRPSHKDARRNSLTPDMCKTDQKSILSTYQFGTTPHFHYEYGRCIRQHFAY